ncbi:periplasmic binding protein [Ignisphaera aggregans DSM 17230]|uniref:Periplasmic binding protein n=1 Tax=Ignisphaera aggregans (strain DSM 17230 / JCM 13409 / AQ1.S1) TaxID=583356 RepID=E0STT3_IGNAA|nr:periplasmic binding protein [Ignisphaera aggregans DSM 17230]
MNRSIVYIAIVIIIAVIAIIIGYYIGTTQRGATTTISTSTVLEPYITVTDFANRTIKIPRNISRIVAIGPGALRLVVYLNATDMVVGVEEIEKTWDPVGRDYAMAVYNRFKDLPTIGPGGPGRTPDPERILAVKPDLVVMSLYYAQLYDPDKLQQEVGAPVVVVDYTPATSPDLSAFYRALRLLGTVLNRSERAEELINYVENILNDLRQRVKGVDTSMVRVYVGAVSYRGAQPFTATQSPYPPLWWLSTKSIVDNATSTRGFINIDFEYLISMQPDIVFIDENNLNVVLQDFNRSSDKYCSLKAFRDGKVYGLLPYNYYHTNLAVALADAYYIGKVLYPDRFTDIDPIEKANEIFMKFLDEPLYQKYIDGGYLGFTNLSDLFGCVGE